MPKLNVFIDGSWLFNACRYGRAMASSTENQDSNFNLDFAKLNAALKAHVSQYAKPTEPLEDGVSIIATSIFEISEDTDQWPTEYPDACTTEGIERVKNGVRARERFVEGAFSGGYSNTAVFRPRLRPYIVESLGEGRYQEKQVDATVVALIVKYAITEPDNYHILISGDKDMLPAIQVACPEFTVNVGVATTHPDGLSAEQRQSSFSLFSYNFAIPPYILEEHSEELIAGTHPYKCRECAKVFVRPNPVPRTARPTCGPSFRKKEPYKK